MIAESPMVGARVPSTWGSNKFNLIAASSGRKEAEVVREALVQYLGETATSVKGAMSAQSDERFRDEGFAPISHRRAVAVDCAIALVATAGNRRVEASKSGTVSEVRN